MSELHIHCKSLLMRVYDHAECKEYCIGFNVALKCSMYLIRNKCTTMYCNYGKRKCL